MSAPVLIIGGMDSSGGAGVLRDAATVAALGGDSRVAVTAVTAQSDRAVSAVHMVPPAVVAAQIITAAQGPIGAAKVGMLVTRRIVETVAEVLPDAPLVLDPVIRSSSGRTLLDSGGVRALIATLLPRTTVLTPNLPELAALAAQVDLAADAAEPAIARALLAQGCQAVLVKGGHADAGDMAEDRLYLGGGDPIRLTAPRIGIRLRGTGCFLASAIALYLARGDSIPEAAGRAKQDMQARFVSVATAAEPG
ncbi:bifunctional hydroxymethylpyrimidine kinase/phosphomethylpyrimidine kinase [Paracoccus pacificus]|uniref:hydroxymethylpyrimidine kinase n=1 Tax=Paracoccus pacificus TaxID=1463598 RepID=A0ABW4RAH4_9RHOB